LFPLKWKSVIIMGTENIKKLSTWYIKMFTNSISLPWFVIPVKTGLGWGLGPNLKDGGWRAESGSNNFSVEKYMWLQESKKS